MLEDALVALIIADTTGVNSFIAGRIYPVQAPPDNPVYPYITYQDITGSSEYTFDAPGSGGDECGDQAIQFDVWTASGVTYGTGKQIGRALRNLLSGYVGTLSEGTRILFAERGNQMDNFDVDQRAIRSVYEYHFLISEQ